MMRKYYMARQEGGKRSTASVRTKPASSHKGGTRSISSSRIRAIHSIEADSGSANSGWCNEDVDDCAAPLCLRPADEEVDWVQCDGGCEGWFHMHCVGVVKHSFREDEDYYCTGCQGRWSTHAPVLMSRPIGHLSSPEWSEQHESLEQPVVKEELPDPDIDNLSSLDAAGSVKTEPADLDNDLYSLEEGTIFKQEMNIEPTVIRPPDFQYMSRPCKPEPEEAATSEKAVDSKSRRDSRHTEESASTSAASQQIDAHSVEEHNGPYRHHIGKKNLKLKNLIENHVLTIHTNKTEHQTNFKRHMLTHTRNPRYCCKICKTKFTLRSNLKRHLLIHTGEQPHCCSVCNKPFLRKCYLKTHMKLHTGERLHYCSVCNKYFARNCDLNAHMKFHTSERPHCCSVCNKSFVQKYHLKSHMRLHTSVRPHCCSVCSKSFKRKCYLKTHMKLHTSERHYCSVCSKSFKWKFYLKTHMKFHTGERPHCCSLCSKSYVLKYHLQFHMMCHTGERPHCCTVCSKSFMRKYDLKTHMKTHIEKHWCGLCDKSFMRKCDLITHIYLHTSERPHLV